MDSIIAYRLHGGKLQFVMDGEDVKVFPNMDEAVDYAINNKLFQSGQADYQVIELDEL